jgi:hypothetical protein
MSIVHTAGSTGPLDFDAVAAPEPPATELVERKVCEGLCGGCFYRPVPANARVGEKICAACQARMVPAEVSAKWDHRRADLCQSMRFRKYRKAS